MIGFLSGTLLEKQPPTLLIDVNGVGYEVDAPMTTIYDLPDVGAPVKLYTHFVVREDAQQLYGFSNQRDRALFRDLIKVSGIGAKMALAILSGMDADTVVTTILDHDTTMLVQIPGIGKKTAERLVVEMSDKLAKWNFNEGDLGHRMSNEMTIGGGQDAPSEERDALNALISLGYKPQEATRMIKAVLKDHTEVSSEAMIKLALQGSMR